MGREKLLELLNVYSKSSYEIDNNFTLDYIKEKIQFLDAWILNNIEKAPKDLFKFTEEQLAQNRNKITEIEINNITLPEEELEGLTEEEIIEKKKDKILANQIKGEAFWKDSTQQLIDFFQEEFIPLLNENDANNSEETKYSENMKIIKNRHRINVKDLNDNFELITEGLKRIFENVLSDENGIYKNFFKLVLSDLVPLWENVLFLWIMYILKNSYFDTKPLIKYVYLDETDFFPSKKFDFTNSSPSILLKDISKKIGEYVHQYQDCNLIIVPIIRFNNYEKNYYSKEIYPGIFYHPAFLNNKLFKPNEKFIIYPFAVITDDNTNSFIDGSYLTITTENSSLTRELSLSEQIYGYAINGDHLYYTAPFCDIPNIKEFIPKKYYCAVRTILDLDIEHHINNLILKNFNIKCYDAVQENLKNIPCEIGSITLQNNNNIEISFEEILKDFIEKDIIIKSPLICIFNKNEKVEKKLHKISNFRIKMNRDTDLNLNHFKFYQGECISYYQNSINEDYSYLIEYVPLKSDTQINLITETDLDNIKNSYVGDITLSTSLGYQDNDILKKHFIWDKKHNNILEDKFVLRIGQHLEKGSLIDSDKQEIVSDYLINEERKYFDYNINHEIEEKNKNEIFYNSVTIDVGAYLHNPFLKGKDKKVIYYPDFLSHTFGTDYLIPTDVVECLDRQINGYPEYFSYNELLKNYHINKDVYYNIYTVDGKENLQDDWAIEMIEVISQPAPSKRDFSAEFPTELKTIKELYNFHITNNNFLNNKKLYPFFTQLCPSKTTETITNEFSIEQLHTIQQQVKAAYSNIVDYFYPNASSERKDEILNDIYNKLFNSYNENLEYPIHYKHIIDVDKQNLDTGLSRNLKYRLSIYGSATEAEINNNIQDDWWEDTDLLTKSLINDECLDAFYKDPNVNISGVKYGNKYYEKYLGGSSTDNIDLFYSLHPVENKNKLVCVAGPGRSENENSSYYFFYSEMKIPKDGYYLFMEFPHEMGSDHRFLYITKIYKISNGQESEINNFGENPIHFTGYPQIQLNNLNHFAREVLDETFEYLYNKSNKILSFGYLYYGFGCTNRFFTEGANCPLFDFQIFGANFPFANYFEDIVQNITHNKDLTLYMPFGGNVFKIIAHSHNPSAWPYIQDNLTGRGLISTFNSTQYGHSYKTPIGKYGDQSPDFNDACVYRTGKYELYNNSTSFLSPFLNILAYPKIKAIFIAFRQYPHIFLSSKKTAFPQDKLLDPAQSFLPTKFLIYFKSNNIIQKGQLKNYFSKLFDLTDKQIKSLPYPLPLKTFTDIIEQDENIDKPTIDNGVQFLLENNFNHRLTLDTSKVITSDDVYSVRENHYYQLNGNYPSVIENYSGQGYLHKLDFKRPILDTQIYSAAEVLRAAPIFFPFSIPSYSSLSQQENYYKIMSGAENIYNINNYVQTNYESYPNNFSKKISLLNIDGVIGTDSGTYTAYTSDIDNSINANTELASILSSNVKNMNLQIIIHWFGSNGEYSRKIMTRQIDLKETNNDTFEYNLSNQLIYNEWTNNWKIETFSSNPNIYSFESFKNKFKNNTNKIFKRSPNFETRKILDIYPDYEQYPNTGFQNEQAHTEFF